jgi:hypothetical protein
MHNIRRSRGLPIAPWSYFHTFNKTHDSSTLCVLLYGHLRSYSYTLPVTLSYLKSEYRDIHFFVHTWNLLDAGDSPPIFADSLRHLLEEYGSLIGLKVDRQVEGQDSASPLAFMYYSMWAANLLKRQHENTNMVRYARCLKIRPDVLLKPSSQRELPKIGDFYFHGQGHLLSDICALTSSHEMDRICNFLVNVSGQKDREALLLLNLEYLHNELGLSPSPFVYGQDWMIVRSSYDGLILNDPIS